MPDRYWVGGTANWDGTADTKWAATSGGAGGETVPTTADAVFFDAASTGTVTIAAGNTGAASINCTGFTGTITGSAAITVAGSVTLAAAMTYTHTGTITLTGTGTLTTAGKTFSGVTIDGTGITVTLGDAFSAGSANVTVTRGTFDTANFSLTAAALLSNNTNTRTISLGSSTVTLSASISPLTINATNLTFNAGSSLIQLSASTANFVTSGGTVTFNNVSFTGTSAASRSVQGTNVFNNLTISPSSSDTTTVTFNANQTINGTLSAVGGSPIRRIYLASNTLGIARTLTINSAPSLTDMDFRDITVAGTAAPVSGTRIGDRGGCSGITFSTPKTVYWNLAGANSWIADGWATTSGGTPAADNYPLPQDTAVIDNSSAGTEVRIPDGSLYSMSSIDASLRTTAFTINIPSNAGTASFYGNFELGSGISLTVSGSQVWTFFGRGVVRLITSAGKTFPSGVTVNAPGGQYRLLDALTTLGTFTLTGGTLDINGNTLTALTFNSNNSNTRTIAFGAGNITVTGTGTVFTTNSVTGLTVTGTPVVNVTNNTATATTIQPGLAAEANAISFNITGGTYALTLNNHVLNLNFTGFAGTLNNSPRVIFGDLTLSTGMTLAAGGSGTAFSSTSATPRTIITNGKIFSFSVNFNGVGGTYRLLDAFTMASLQSLTHAGGTLDLNGFNLTVGSTYATFSTNPKNLLFNGGTLTCPSALLIAFNNAAPTGFTTTAGTGTGTINMTAATAKSFQGGGSTYNCTLNNGGAGTLTITGSNTFTTLSNSVQPTGFQFTAGTTTTLTNWNINGTAGNLVTIDSSSPTSHTLSKAGGAVVGNYLSISRSNATGGATWNAVDSTDGGNNTGWVFGPGPPPPPPPPNTMLFFLLTSW
jgi:hypothetical protein